MKRVWRIRLRHLFVVVAVVALGVWLHQHLGLEIVRHPRMGGYFSLYWDRREIYSYNFFHFDAAESSGSTAGNPP